jgi:phosphate transport system permease protein
MAPSTDTKPLSIPRQRSVLARKLDSGFVRLTGVFGIGVGLLLLLIAAKVGLDSLPAMGKFGLGFLTQGKWTESSDTFGALPQIYGTLVSSAIALIIALPISLGVSIFLSEDFLPPRIQQPLVFMVELLAAIPSVVYGIWGIYVLTPLLQGLGVPIHKALGWLPLFGTEPRGPGIYVAGVILAIMVLPIMAAISRDALAAVPPELRQAAYGLGATRWETLLKVILPTASSGIVGGVMLALGRAMGETMATTMVIGNTNRISLSIFDGGSTIASLLANKFAEAKDLEISALMYAAFVLFIITLIVNILAELIVRRVRMKV